MSLDSLSEPAPSSDRLAPLIGADEIAAWSDAVRESGRTLVMTNGCFDLVHPGHVASLVQASTFGDVLLVAINDDRSIRELKGEGRPLLDEASRALILRALRPVGAVTIFGDRSVGATVERVRPDVLAKGGEYSKAQVVGGERLSEWGGRVELLDMVPDMGTTRLLQLMQERPPSGPREGDE